MRRHPVPRSTPAPATAGKYEVPSNHSYTLGPRYSLLCETEIAVFSEEELGGAEGMGKFSETEKFKSLNIGFTLDEGLASPTDVYKVYYGERCVWCK